MNSGTSTGDLAGKRILIVKQSSLGDVVHALPLVHALKRCHPTLCIDWVVEQAYAPLLKADPAVHTVYPIHIPSTSDPQASKWAYLKAFAATVSTLRWLRRQLRHASCDLVLDLHASFRSGLLSLMNPSGTRIGFADARELNTWFQHRLVANRAGLVHAIDKNLLFGELLGCRAEPMDFHLCPPPRDRDQVDRWLAAEGVKAGATILYLSPTARWQSKFWPAERWAAFADRLLSAGLAPVFGGSGGDLSYIDSITTAMTGRATVAAGRLSLTESAALMQRASAYVGLDTGPMHMAAMTGTPVVALFGPTHPDRVGPYGVKSTVLQAGGVDCLCCRRRTCEHLRCMLGITVDQVFAAVLAITGNTRAAG